MYRYRAYFSLNVGDGIEHEAAHTSMSPQDILKDKFMREQLYAALAILPEKQRKRIYQYYFLGISKSDIARTDGISEKNIRQSIKRGLQRMLEYLKNNF